MSLIINSNEKAWKFLAILTLFLAPLTIAQAGLMPRFLVQWIPIWCLFASHGLEFGCSFLVNYLNKWNIRTSSTVIWLVMLSILILFTTPSSKQAYDASRSLWLEEIVGWMTQNTPVCPAKGWIFSNFAPTMLRDNLEMSHATWLTTSWDDAKIFSVQGRFTKPYDIPPPGLPLDILNQEGGVVVQVIFPLSTNWNSPQERQQAMHLVSSTYTPNWTWYSSTQIPPGMVLPDKVEIYCMNGKK